MEAHPYCFTCWHVNVVCLYACTLFCFRSDQVVSLAPRYKLDKDLARWLSVDEDTGLVKVKHSMDRESHHVKDDKYTVLILGYDNGKIPIELSHPSFPLTNFHALL